MWFIENVDVAMDMGGVNIEKKIQKHATSLFRPSLTWPIKSVSWCFLQTILSHHFLRTDYVSHYMHFILQQRHLYEWKTCNKIHNTNSYFTFKHLQATLCLLNFEKRKNRFLWSSTVSKFLYTTSTYITQQLMSFLQCRVPVTLRHAAISLLLQ